MDVYRSQPAPPPGMTERRKSTRRETDDEARTLADLSVKNSWFVNRLIRWSKIGGAVIVILALSNTVLGALNIRIVGSKDDVKSLRLEILRRDSVVQSRIAANVNSIREMQANQDSMVTLLTKMNQRLERQEILFCLTSPASIRSNVCKGIQ